MHVTRKWLMVGSAAVVLALGTGAAVWYFWPHEDVASHRSSKGWSVALGQDGGGGSAGAQGQLPLASGQSAASAERTPLPLSGSSGAATGGSGSVNGTSTANGGNSAEQTGSVPGPEGFAVYEQYKGSATALYQDIRPGNGEQAASGKTLVTNYRGWLTNGQEFDESYARGNAFSFILGAGKVIPGWDQGLMGMKVGGKRRLVVPAKAGYGATAMNGIPANSMLIFDVELLAVQ